MGLQKYMTLKRTKLLKQPNKLQLLSTCAEFLREWIKNCSEQKAFCCLKWHQ